MRLGITGSHAARANRHYEAIEERMAEVGSVAELTTGACEGADTMAGKIGVVLWPYAIHRVVIPYNRSKVVVWWTSIEIEARLARHGGQLILEEMPPGTSYRDRNHRIVENSDYMLAFPIGRLDKPYSGTWMTHNIAKAHGVPIDVYSL